MNDRKWPHAAVGLVNCRPAEVDPLQTAAGEFVPAFQNMAYDQIEKFHLDRRFQSSVTVVVAVCYTAMAVTSWPDVLNSTLVALAGIILIAPIWSMDVVVHRDGIRMYGVNRLCWSDITAVRKRSVLSLPYLHITRAKGLKWWLPLYFTGPRDMLTAIAEKAPAGNPVKVFANGR